MLKWVSKDRKKTSDSVNTIVIEPVDERVLSTISSTDILTHVVNQSIAAWKNGSRIFVWQLNAITDIQKISNRLLIFSDDNVPTTLNFVSVQECELASQKFTDAGNGAIV